MFLIFLIAEIPWSILHVTISIFSKDFSSLWSEIWGNSKIYNDDYKQSLEKFEDIIDMKDELKLNSRWDSPEWGFPKGRRNHKETDYDCAIREFSEETGYNPKLLENIQNIIPYEEIFTGSNYKSYKHKYFVI